MKIIGKQPSREKCAESGWFAWDYLLDEPDRAGIHSEAETIGWIHIS